MARITHDAVLSTLEGDPRFFFDDSLTLQAQGTGSVRALARASARPPVPGEGQRHRLPAPVVAAAAPLRKVVSSNSTELVVETDAGKRMSFELDPETRARPRASPPASA